MKIVLTTHAKQRMIERGIKLKEIKDVIEFPDYSIAEGNKIQAHKEVNSKSLKIVYSKQSKFIKIVTVILK